MTTTASSSSSSSSSSTASSSAFQIPSITIHGPAAREQHLGLPGGGGGSNGRLRTRSPKGQRGRPRKAASATTGMSAPPIQAMREDEVGKGKAKGRWMGSRVRKGLVIVMVVVVLVGLLISAIRIISREPLEEGQALRRPRSPILPRRRDQDPSNDERHRHAPPPPSGGKMPAPPARRAPTQAHFNPKPDSEATKKKKKDKDPGSGGGDDAVTQGVLLDEVVKDALADVWDLEKNTLQEGSSSSSPRNPKRDPAHKGTDDETGEDGEKKDGSRSLQELYADLEGMGFSVDDLTQALDEAYRGGDGVVAGN
ncbi:BQ2448_139 [Microbotryum intermedium]|uniref:BQ2448_139 protein n=1 Tax=Microbotryum intermedium TaxID=269621 RepID=A0A238FA68_9BASI|nr:BQ2448_139 [Microbotryum intermedium]